MKKRIYYLHMPLVFFLVAGAYWAHAERKKTKDCKAPLADASYCASTHPDALQKTFLETFQKNTKQSPDQPYISNLEAAVDAHLTALEAGTHALSDAEVQAWLNKWIKEVIKDRGYLPGLTPREVKVNSVEVIVEQFVEMNVFDQNHEDHVRNITGNIVALTMNRKYFLPSWIKTLSTDEKAQRNLVECVEEAFRVLMFDTFKRRLRDGKWTGIKNAALKKRYKEKVMAENYPEVRKELITSKSWQDIDVVNVKFTEPSEN